MTMLTISGGNVVLNRDLTPADDGVVTYTVTATQNGVNVSATGTLTITAVVAPPVPLMVALNPASAMLADNVTAGAQVAAATVTMSDGSTFTGTLDVSGPA